MSKLFNNSIKEKKMKKSNKICHFFDQNVMEKISRMKPGYKVFQENFNNTLMGGNVNQALPPFSFLEFIGVQAKDILKVAYKGKLLRDYACGYNELKDIISDLKKQIEEKVTKDLLQKKLLEKKQAKSDILTDVGYKVIEACDNYLKDESLYQNLLRNLYLDRLPQINTSKFSLEEKTSFNIEHYYPSIMRNICDKTRTLGSFRAIIEMIKSSTTSKEIEKRMENICQKNKNIDYRKNKKAVSKILRELKLKPHADLADCELIHLACFGYNGYYCRCYTADPEELIEKRLNFYCESICVIEGQFYDYLPKTGPYWKKHCEKFIPRQRPDWKCGEVIILDRDTGQKITEIPVKKIYEKKQNETIINFKELEKKIVLRGQPVNIRSFTN